MPHAVDRHVQLAVLGAGPVGLDAALAATERDLDVVVLESSDHVAGGIRRWGHVRLFTPWSMNLSARMRRVLEAEHVLPQDEAVCPTGQELIDGALAPVAAHLGSRVRLGHRVISIGREGLLKHEAIGDPKRSDHRFRLLVEHGGEQIVVTADRVLDCTGSPLTQPLGYGGIPAPGEVAVQDRIHHDIPGTDLESWAGESILLAGGGHSGQTAALRLAALAERHPETKIIWLLRTEPSVEGWGSPEGDPLEGRRKLAEKAGHLVRDLPAGLEILSGRYVDRIAAGENSVDVALVDAASGAGETRSVDRIVALTGRVGDHTLYRELQVHECWATSGPMKLAGALLGADGASGGDCLAQESPGADTLRNPEPGFFILGSKSYGRRNDFLLRVGYEQVDGVFELLAAG